MEHSRFSLIDSSDLSLQPVILCQLWRKLSEKEGLQLQAVFPFSRVEFAQSFAEHWAETKLTWKHVDTKYNKYWVCEQLDFVIPYMFYISETLIDAQTACDRMGL